MLLVGLLQVPVQWKSNVLCAEPLQLSDLLVCSRISAARLISCALNCPAPFVSIYQATPLAYSKHIEIFVRHISVEKIWGMFQWLLPGHDDVQNVAALCVGCDKLRIYLTCLRAVHAVVF
jgi:hypothetical protein